MARIAHSLTVPVFGSGDCVEPEQIVDRLRSGVDGVLVGRGVLRNPWILAQAADMVAGRPPREVSMTDRGQFLLDYIDLLMAENGYERWVVNKIRALGSWYTKGIENGSHLRTAINTTDSVAALRDLVARFFFTPVAA